jgi:hypothetical protein
MRVSVRNGCSGLVVRASLLLACLGVTGAALANESANRSSIGELRYDGGRSTGLRVNNTLRLSPSSDIQLQRSNGVFSHSGAEVRVSTYHVAWRYALVDSSNWTLRVGLGSRLRDSRDPWVTGEGAGRGALPMVQFQGERKLSDRVRLIGDVDGIASGPMRSIDMGLRVRYALTPDLSMSAGLRVLESSFDSPEAAQGPRNKSVTFGVGYRF